MMKNQILNCILKLIFRLNDCSSDISKSAHYASVRENNNNSINNQPDLVLKICLIFLIKIRQLLRGLFEFQYNNLQHFKLSDIIYWLKNDNKNEGMIHNLDTINIIRLFGKHE